MKFLGRNVQISPKAIIGKNVKIGDNTTIYEKVEIGNNSIIANNCILGEPTTEFYTSKTHACKPTIIGENALIRSHAIIYENVIIGNNFQSGHRLTIRENTRIGVNCGIGTNSDVQGFTEIGDYCHFHSDVHICQFSKIGDYVFIYPGVVLANDKYPPSNKLAGPSIGNYTQIGIQSSVIGDVKIGENSLIGASTVVVKSFAEYSFVLGNPARLKGDTRNLKDEKGKPLYPWKTRFSRGMPWREID